jgi:nitroreductase
MNRLFNAALKRTGAMFLLDYLYDAARFLKSKNTYFSVRKMDAEGAKMHLLRLMHSIEKGLSLPNPAPGFGKSKVVHLKKEAEAYLDKFGRDDIYRLVMSTLAAHQAWQTTVGGDSAGFSLDDLRRESGGMEAGARDVAKEQIWRHAKINFDAFALHRHSVRNFTGEPVSAGDIVDAIKVATKSPSVCNRACARAYYSVNSNTMAKLLSMQNGNRGFGDTAGAVIVVAADMRAFYKNGERNQGWIDGGLFAMSLHYALHARGYGACMLNWSMDATSDRHFRRQFGIPTEHLIVMLMAVGHLPDRLKVAVSPRRDISEFAFDLDKSS